MALGWALEIPGASHFGDAQDIAVIPGLPALGLLRQRFVGSHGLEIITSVDDVQKALYYDYPELMPYTLDQRKVLLSEHRAAIMEWFFLSANRRGE